MPDQVELFESREVSAELRDGNLMRIFHIKVRDPVNCLNFGPAYGEFFGDTKLKVRTKKAFGLTHEWCRLEVTYLPAESSPEKDSFELDLMGQTAHIDSVEKQTDQIHFPTSDVEGALDASKVGTIIGLNGNRIEGVDIFAPHAVLTLRRWIPLSNLTAAYKRILYTMVGTVNDATFEDWEAGELLYVGASISGTEGDLVQILYKFLGRANEALIEIATLDKPNGVQVQNKQGWQYLWLGTSTRISPGSDPEYGVETIHVATVYKSGSFAALQIEGEGTFIDSGLGGVGVGV